MNKIDSIINSLSFTFYSADEIRKLAVKEITSLISIEPTLGKGAVNGLYDSELGSLSDREPCRKCNLSYYDCNGHFGRIEFSKPIYNPVLFDYLLKLLKGVCFFCHKLSLNQGLFESLQDLSNKGDLSSIKKFSDLEDLNSLSNTEKEKNAIKILAAQLRRNCSHCSKKSIVFTKSRKGEILAHLCIKTRNNKDEPDSKKRKLDSHPEKKYSSNFTENDLYDKFTEQDSSVNPEIVREHLRLLWVNEHEALKLIFPMLKNCKFEFPTDVFFMENMLVNPPMNRLPAIMGGDKMTEAPETTNMSNVVRAAATLRDVLKTSKDINKEQQHQNVREAILELQRRVNICFDSNTHREVSGAQPGLRQRIDKKTGLFRQNIMAKRVNYALRSVISPDPNVGLDEIGVPIRLLSKLTFSEPMNPYNKDYLKKCILNGQDVFPGATSYQIGNKVPVAILNNRDTTAEFIELMYQKKERIIINRHANTGDVIIMNRQPTLHRPSMQAHFIKEIHDPKAKTLRMHYSNCKAYNADFDGDEMNGHFPQSIQAQSEAKTIMNVCHNYNTPKDGSPLAGLIQDHVIAGTRMSMRNCFLKREEYLDLVMHGLRDKYSLPLKLQRPAILKPKPLWTGKQVLSTVIINAIPTGMERPNIVCSEPKKNKIWNVSDEELKLQLSDVELIIIDGIVCTGIFDKTHLGPSRKGLCSDLRELYGEQAALTVLTCLSRTLNRYLIYTSFSVGIRDAFLNKPGEDVRKNIMGKMRSVGLMSVLNAFKMSPETATLECVTREMEKAQFDKSDEYRNKMVEIDGHFKTLSSTFTEKLGSVCKENLAIKFPRNNISFMLNTGAKGAESNLTKIAIGLGAIEIEGKRCPLTLSGRTLPCFPRYDVNPASRGFCSGRFSSGLTPQEVFFESMAGRDGLVDTAVKTSSSGYLQRCLIKHMEDLAVRHDGTVRDNMDNIIQFKYGYDGLDVIKSTGLERSDYRQLIKNNMKLFCRRFLGDKYSSTTSVDDILQIIYKIAQVVNGEPVGLIAAQSIGEPSTQMTLNTFHNAGQSEMNVTLGIPRLREILITCSDKITTPSMMVPIVDSNYARTEVKAVFKKFSKLHLKDVLKLPFSIEVGDYHEVVFRFKKRSEYRHLTDSSKKELIRLIEKIFLKSLAKYLKKLFTMTYSGITEDKDNDMVATNQKDDEGDDENAEVEDKIGQGEKDENSDLSDIDSEVDDDESDEPDEFSDDEREEVVNEDDLENGSVATHMDNKKSHVPDMYPGVFRAYHVDPKQDPKWIKLVINLKGHFIDLKSLLLGLIEKTVISSIDGINKALIITRDNCFATEGYNHLELFKYNHVFDLNHFYTNNVAQMNKLYGIEAAVACIEKEVNNVFKSYNIDVNSRHLRLIADYMTFSGSVRGFNRHAMKEHSSQVQRASTETALTVLKEMAVHGKADFINSPSANLMFGQPVSHIGTNSVVLRFNY